MPTVEVEIVPRSPFRNFLNSQHRWACLVCHRRAGKTFACVQKLFKAAIETTRPDARFAYIAPTYAQAKDVAWAYLKQYAAPIPGTEVRESDLSVIFPNGARIRLYGSDNYDRLRGLYLDGCVIDEAGDQDPRAWPEVIRPALADRGGWAVFIGTPKGKNGFHRIYDAALKDDDWYTLVLKASESGLLPEAELADARKMLTEDQYAQEFECSFEAAITGAYFAGLLRDAEADGRICNLAHDALMPVWTYWDIGGTGKLSDATAIWVVQLVGKEIRVIDYYEVTGQPLSAHVEWLRGQGYGNARVVLPHDGGTNDKVHNVSFESALRQAGFPVEVVPNQGTGAARRRIEAGRRRFPTVWFDKRRTSAGRDALAHYHEKHDAQRGIGLGPMHDWASHGADAFGLLCIHARDPIKRPAMRGPKMSMV